ncbi:MAG: cupin domain-containing protein [Pseudomonadota bacterium]|nr:cupin domain-containing protein [Pseudomonadota bacterium]
MPGIVLFELQQTAPEVDYPRPERLVASNPKRTTWNHYSNDSGEVFSGVWACEPGAWRIAMGAHEDEFFFVTRGRCRVRSDDGVVSECGAGQSLVIPAGFSGVFEVVEAMEKHYMIVDRKVPEA